VPAIHKRGFKFPDGAVQTTAAKGAQGLVHDNTLNGNGSAKFPAWNSQPLGYRRKYSWLSKGIAPLSRASHRDQDFTNAGVTGFNEGGGSGVFGQATIAVLASGTGSFPGTGLEGVADNGVSGDTGVLGVSLSPGLARPI
jgi:hypothetical protein